VHTRRIFLGWAQCSSEKLLGESCPYLDSPEIDLEGDSVDYR